jgi:hypothetical protein
MIPTNPSIALLAVTILIARILFSREVISSIA